MTTNPIAAWRKRMGLTQTEAALALGCGRRSLQNWENGLPELIPPYILLACAALTKGIRPIK